MCGIILIEVLMLGSRQSPERVHCYLDSSRLELATNSTGTFHYTIQIDDEIPLGSLDGFDFQGWAEIDFEGDLHIVPLGGLRIMVQTVEQVEIELDLEFDGGAIASRRKYGFSRLFLSRRRLFQFSGIY